MHINLFAQVFLAANMFVMTLFCVYRQLCLLLALAVALGLRHCFFSFSYFFHWPESLETTIFRLGSVSGLVGIFMIFFCGKVVKRFLLRPDELPA